MKGLLDNAQIDVPCPKCGHTTKERLGRLKNNPQLRCIRCGSSIQIDASGPGGLAQGAKRIDKSMDEVRRSLTKLGKLGK